MTTAARRDRRARATAGAGLLALALLAAACAGTDTGTPSATTGTRVPTETTAVSQVPLEEGTQLTTYNPSVGDCFDERRVTANGTTSDIVLKLECTKPHQYEIFHVIEWAAPDWTNPDPKSRAHPGDEALRKWGKAECPKAFRAYVGQQFELSALELGYLMPPESTWPSNRRLGCYVRDPSGRNLEQSVRDSRM